MTRSHRDRLGLAAVLATTGTLHLVSPRWWERLLPRWLPGPRRAWNVAAAAAELGSAALLAVPRTARVGGWAAFATLSTVYVANVQHAVDGHIPGTRGFAATRTFALLRLPLQFPLLRMAWRTARRPPW